MNRSKAVAEVRVARLIARVAHAVLQDVRAHPMHHVLSVLSLSIGTIAIVLTVVMGDIAQEVFVAKEEQRTARAATYRAALDPETVNDLTLDTRRRVQEDIERSGGAAAFTAEMSGVVAPPEGPPVPTNLHVYSGEYSLVRRLPVLEGRWSSGAALPVQIVVNTGTKLHAGETVAVRAGTSLPEVQATVAAVISDGDGQPAYYLPWSTCDEFLPCKLTSPLLLLHGRTPKEGFEQYLSRYDGRLTPELDRYDSAQGLIEQLSTLGLVFGVCGGVALLVSSVGLMNLGLATIRHRTRELAIRRAIGARRDDILTLVLGSALTVGVAGAVVAVAVVWVGARVLIPSLIDPASGVVPPPFPIAALAVGLAVSVTTSLLAAVAPAIQASRVELASVLRE